MSRQPKLFEPNVTIPEDLSESVALWRAYKKRQYRFTYTAEALAALVERMAEMGPERAMAAVKWSMGGSGHPYKGLFEPPGAKGGERQSWDEQKQARIIRELQAPGIRAVAPPFEIGQRLTALASSLPEGSPFCIRVLSLMGVVDVEEIEAALVALDVEMLDAARAGLNGAEREITEGVEKTLALLRGRVPVAELEKSRERLFQQGLRRRLNLPVLSLFSPEAEP